MPCTPPNQELAMVRRVERRGRREITWYEQQLVTHGPACCAKPRKRGMPQSSDRCWYDGKTDTGLPVFWHLGLGQCTGVAQ